ncbi:MAG: hypothetical protein A2934_04760 [Candidatus Sungbacteria bacterium RIFCSPLOWO2_01_FULL_47_10]|uniref:Uncharacterized protein n=1 Tax=Candidatus Sungbacteria bacterium RIFCSPLOWO2_01_FULL_47_10 TaxID=1802276 RepID=A0A1G2L4H3_9BACT|nr:MAG: hypothetical protein A2934_04760 [Candidatus Sungbacteria bacterium RIFCSPLOWO2_01_FULL_47_10]
MKLQLTGATTTIANLAKVTFWDGATKVGEGLFTSATNASDASTTPSFPRSYASTTLTANFLIPKDGDKIMTIKGDLAAVGTSQSGTEGSWIKVDYDGGEVAATQGVGQSSGTTINTGSASDTSSNGVRMFKTFPTVAKVALSTNSLENGQRSLLRFKVTADSHGDVGLYKFTFTIATTGVNVDSIAVYGYVDSAFSNAAYANGGLLNNTAVDLEALWADSTTNINVTFDPVGQGGTAEVIQVPAGTTRYFDVLGTVSNASAGDSISTQLQGDAAYPATAWQTFGPTAPDLLNAGTTDGVDNDTNDDFIWSPQATTTVSVSANAFTNGYGVSGLPSTNLSAEILSK